MIKKENKKLEKKWNEANEEGKWKTEKENEINEKN